MTTLNHSDIINALVIIVWKCEKMSSWI